MTLTTGARLGPYEILGPLGAGGMGEVYRARDTRLDRSVAVKVLPEHLAATPELRTRFEREARAVSSLNHPNICVLHDVGSQDGVDYLVMELVEGETLGARLERGALATPDVLRYGIEIADALDRAHRSGIVHRDLKPGNVMLTKSGAKLLDFGLARGSGLAATTGSLTNSPTVTRPLTTEGAIVGTFQYMSPEQLEGKEADARSDLFGFGAVLFEMATGRRAFEGKSQASLISAIMSSQPPAVSSVSPLSPPGLDRIVSACLAKDPDERIQTAHDVKLQLQWIRDAGSQAGVPAPVVARRKSRERLGWILAGVGIAAAAALALPRLILPPVEVRPVRFAVRAPADVRISSDPLASVLSPDGRMLAFIAADTAGAFRIYLRPLESLAAQPLEGTDNAYAPFWSPDSRHLGYFADGKLKKVPASGGLPEVVCDAPDARGGSWSSSGTIVFAPIAVGPLVGVSAEGGEPAEIIRPDSTQNETGFRWPQMLPDGKHFLFASLPARANGFDIYVGAVDSKQRKRLLSAASTPVYSAPGYLLYARNSRLVAQRFDAAALKLKGEPVSLGEAPALSNALGAPAVSVSQTGNVARVAASLANTELRWMDRSGRETGSIPVPPGRYQYLALSPSGDRLVMAKLTSASQSDLWMMDLSRALMTRFTFGTSGQVENPVWSPDGKWVAYNAQRNGRLDLFRKLASGGADEEPVYASDVLIKNLSHWSSDGRSLVFDQPDPKTGWDVWTVPVEGDHTPVPVLHSRFNEKSGEISPDGRWIAYHTDESGRPEVCVQSYPSTGSKYQVSTNGGANPSWSKDGREIVFGSLDGVGMSAQVLPGTEFHTGTPRALFRLRSDVVSFTASADMQRVLISVPAGRGEPTAIEVELNWTAALKKK